MLDHEITAGNEDVKLGGEYKTVTAWHVVRAQET
jgi:hypothetical protein